MIKIKSQLPIVIWLTGLSGSGKSTIANKIYQILIQKGYKIKLIDGDEFRGKNTDFSKSGIMINNRNIITICENSLHTNDFIIVSVISPFNNSRNEARVRLGKKYMEVYVKASLKTVINRDTKGYYKKALSGKIDHFIGIDPITPYEKPTNPEIIINTDNESEERSLQKLLDYLKNMKYIKEY
ncbi:MAG: adenylyl-sulfate kinase [Candidatus Marinimicrobia bacterium]|nr:adenylyl-sulfate kinase [Candidatus Neomarinimicrobiota bacterium]